jgi:ADP-ribosylglycohydrolase
MPTQLLSRQQIHDTFGRITWFRDARPEHPIAAGMHAGSVTDDTEQALLLARRLIADHGRVDARRFAADLAGWEDDMRARGSLDLLGPSTQAALLALAGGATPDEAGWRGSTNGAAMRVTPVGIACAPDDLTALVDRVEESARITHNTGIALAAACAVAAAVSTGISCAGRDTSVESELFEKCVRQAVAAARLGALRGHWTAGADVARRIGWAVELADRRDTEGSLTRIAELIGTSLASQESVPAAFGVLALFPGDPWRACLAAAGLGGDTDTIAAIAGAIGGAVFGPIFPADAVRTVEQVSGLELAGVADELLALRLAGKQTSVSTGAATGTRTDTDTDTDGTCGNPGATA